MHVPAFSKLRTFALCVTAFSALAACGGGGSGGSSTVVSVTNNAPVANAGTDQTVSLGSVVTLDGSQSSDADGDTLTYSWSLTSSPTGSAASLSATSGVSIDLTPDVEGSYSIELSVSDGTLSATASIEITATSTQDTSITTGLAQTTVVNLYTAGSRVSALGEITSSDSLTWTVPADVNFETASFPTASDLYNGDVSGNDFATEAAALANLSTSDVVEIDTGGDLITAYIFADNYFELYVNGIEVGKDPIPFTEFNSNIVQFRVNTPFSVAMLLVDWEENLGTGTELNNGVANHPGDGGMVAVFKDEAGEIIGVTDSSWKVQTYYMAPIASTDCVTVSGEVRDSSACSTDAPSDLATVNALHWALDEDWMSSGFDDSEWADATTYANTIIGVDNKPAFTNFTDVFDDPDVDAEFIWSSNLILDNEIVVRGTVGSDAFTLSSLAVKSDLILPLDALCDGVNGGTMIPLAWSNAPTGTNSFAMAMYNYPNPSDLGDFSKANGHVVIYDIPADTEALDGGQTDIGIFGINDVDSEQTYAGPCSADATEHNYYIDLYALPDAVGTLNLTANTTDILALTNAVSANALDTANLTLSRIRYNPQDDVHIASSVADDCDTKSIAFEAYSDVVSVSCDTTEMTVTTETFLPYRSGLDGDKANVGIQSWIGRVPIPTTASWTLPLVPNYIDTPTANLSIHYAIGVSVDGIPILHYAKENAIDEIAQLSADYSARDTVLLGEVDQCGGHAGNGEDYHYHTAPFCLMDSHDVSQPLAYMFDGLPLYFGTGGGVYTTDGTDYGAGRYADLDYRPALVKTGDRALDECNAYDVNGDGSEYVYYSSSEAPYSIGCFRGQADQEASSPGGEQWTTDRDLSWSGSDVSLTDYDTLTFDGNDWTFIEVTPGSTNNSIASGNIGLILYRQLSSGEDGYEAGLDCYTFRYRLDDTDTEGTADTISTHCR